MDFAQVCQDLNLMTAKMKLRLEFYSKRKKENPMNNKNNEI